MICNLKLDPSHQLHPRVEASEQCWGRGTALRAFTLLVPLFPCLPPSLPWPRLLRVGQGTQDSKQRLLPVLCTSCSALQLTSVRADSQRLLFHGAFGGSSELLWPAPPPADLFGGPVALQSLLPQPSSGVSF